MFPSLPLARRTTLSAFKNVPNRISTVCLRQTSTSSNAESKASSEEPKKSSTNTSEEAQLVKKKKTLAELDKELELKMKGLAGDGGDAGLELEDGKAVSMKRSVKNNMFRYI